MDYSINKELYKTFFKEVRGDNMNQYDVAGVLKTCAERCVKSSTKKQLVEIIKELKKEFNTETLRSLKHE